MFVFILLFVLVAHWYGDFLLQSDWMARNKSRDVGVLFLHVLTYTSAITVTAVCLFIVFSGPLQVAIAWGVWNGVAHGIVDFFTSRASARYFSAGDNHNGFVVVGFDQLAHQFCLVISLFYVIGA
jgi:hypothetical protein